MPAEKKLAAAGRAWFLYILRCHQGQLYTGITTDVARRFRQHEAGKGAKYLRGKGPLQLLFQQPVPSHSEALKLEFQVKKMCRKDKEVLIRNHEQKLCLLDRLSD